MALSVHSVKIECVSFEFEIEMKAINKVFPVQNKVLVSGKRLLCLLIMVTSFVGYGYSTRW